jgi:hypothetical protein
MAIIYSYPDIGDVQGNDIIVITDADTGNATKSTTIDTLSAYIAAQAGAGTVQSFSVDSSSIPGITTVVTNATTNPLLTVSITGTPGSNKYLDGTGNWTTPAGSGGGALTLTTNFTSGAATLVGTTLNIPVYSTSGGSGTVESITAVAPLTGGTITTTGNIGINQASGSANGFLSSTDWNTFNSKQSTSEKGQADGYAPLDSNNKVPAVHLPDSLVGAVVYQGTWNASANIPALPTPALSNKGHYYIVSASGVYLGITYAIGDWAISNGTDWQKVDNTQDVNSVFGRQGNVVANQSDYATFYADINDAYSDAKVDLNLNVASANPTQVLSWSGTDYVWVNQQSGGGGGAVDSVNGQTGVVSLDTDDIPEGSTNLYNVQSDWTATTGVAVILNKPTLSTVATTGDYSDLLNTPNLATVATTGSYNDLIDKPTIPGGTDIGSTPSASTVVITSSTGSDGTVAAATQSLAGVMTAADKLKLDGIANNATNYGDANVNLLLNQNSAPDNYVLSWTGQAYTWINQSGGLNSFNVQSDTGGDIVVNQANASFKVSGGTELLTTRTNSQIDISLQTTGVTPGQYVNPVLDIDSKGRITSATGGSGGGGISGSGTTTQMAIFDSTNSITSTNTVAVNSSSQVIMEVLAGNAFNFPDDTAALAGGIPFAGLYRTDSTVKINLLGGGGSNADPFVPINGTPTFIHSNKSVITIYDLNFNTLTPANPFYTFGTNQNYQIAASSQGYEKIIVCGADNLSSPELFLVSTDYGQTFDVPNSGSFEAKTNGVFGSISGDTILAIPSTPFTSAVNDLLVSNDAGLNFSGPSSSTFPNHPTTPILSSNGKFLGQFKGFSISSGGKYIAFSARGADLNGNYQDYTFWSNDYGVTFNNFNYNGIYIEKAVPMISGDGRIISVLNITNSSSLSSSLYSDDYGATWTTKDYSYIGITNNSFRRSLMSENGKYYLSSQTNSSTSPAGACVVFYGDNFAQEITSLTSNYIISSQCVRNVMMTSNGQYQSFIDSGNSSPTYQFSSNFGSTWSSLIQLPNIGLGPTYLIDV